MMWSPSYQPELYHHGIKGQKWGVRRYQPYADGSFGKTGRRIQRAERIAERGTPRSYGRAMTKLSRLGGEASSKYAEYSERYNALVTKHHKARDAGKDKKAARLEAKAWKMRAKLEVENANRKVAIKKFAKLGADAAEKGYDIKLTPEYRQSAKARRDQMTAQYCLGIIGNVAVVAANTAADSDYRKAHNTDFSPYAYSSLRTKVTKNKNSTSKTFSAPSSVTPSKGSVAKTVAKDAVRTDMANYYSLHSRWRREGDW